MADGSSSRAATAGGRAQQGNKVAVVRGIRPNLPSVTDLANFSILARVHETKSKLDLLDGRRQKSARRYLKGGGARIERPRVFPLLQMRVRACMGFDDALPRKWGEVLLPVWLQ